LKTSFIDFLLFPAPDAEGTAGQKTGSKAPVLAAFYEEQPGLEEELPEFLGKILAAASASLPEQALLIKLIKGSAYSFSRLARKQSLQYVFIFGIAPKNLGLHFHLPLYQPVAAADAVFILAHPLAAIYEERQKGGKQMSGELWRALKSIFRD
jgi:hypothetical protein